LLTLTVAAAAAILANRFVTAASAQAEADENAIGVARSAASAAGVLVPVDVLGTTIVEAGAAVSAGASLKADADGRAITWATAGARVAIALQAATAAGQFIEVLLIPNAA
jgi:hypothetical protein